ncbi:hypothetical protein TKK_0009899 [Trichogramma kaykai]|uniref:C2H2-type domain-containing protein n=1 Tax=Trichogramma kaykai TaxID=54128 RepID=A0ABD2X1K2_9HYME
MQATDFNNLKVPCTSNEPIEKEKMCELYGKYCEHLKLHFTRHHANQPGADAIIRRIDSNYKLVKNLQVPISKEGKQKRQLKFHMCKFCETDQSHLKVHKLRKHKNEPDVIEMIRLTKIHPPNSREPMKKLLHSGDIIYNTNNELNKGDLRVARKTMYNKTPDDFTACENCKIMVLETDYRKHRLRCTGKCVGSTRNIAQEGRALIPRCHAVANNTLRKRIFPRISNDPVSRCIRYDQLVYEFGNELSSKLRGEQHTRNIVTQLRRLGRKV